MWEQDGFWSDLVVAAPTLKLAERMAARYNPTEPLCVTDYYGDPKRVHVECHLRVVEIKPEEKQHENSPALRNALVRFSQWLQRS